MTRSTSALVLVFALAASAALPLFISPNMMNACIKMMITALFALAFALAMGQAGMLSFGHAALLEQLSYDQRGTRAAESDPQPPRAETSAAHPWDLAEASKRY